MVFFYLNKVAAKNSMITLFGWISIILAAVLFALTYLVENPYVQEWYEGYLSVVERLETAILSLSYTWLIALIILFIFLVKVIIPVLPNSALCLFTGIVFPVAPAFLLNCTGMFLMMTVKYRFGESLGGGNTQKLLRKNETVRTLIEHKGSGNPWVLLAFRIAPGFPQNGISQIYGSMNFGYRRFLTLSYIGLAPKLLSYTFIGRSVYDPLSSKFFIPAIALLVISGVSLLVLGGVLAFFEKSK